MGTPSLLAAQSRQVIEAVNQSSSAFYRRIEGGFVADNGSATAGWVVTLSIDLTASIGYAPVGAVATAAGTAVGLTNTFDADGGAASAYGAVVADISTGTASLDAYWTAADASSALTNAEISAAVGHDNWVRLCDVFTDVTGATAATYTIDYNNRSGAPAAEFDGGLALTEEDYNG